MIAFDATWVVLVLFIGTTAAVAAVIAERAARASAWRKIAQERRWNCEHLDGGSRDENRRGRG